MPTHELQCFWPRAGRRPCLSLETSRTYASSCARELRQRYIHKTAVAIHHNGKSWIGWTRDISTHGLQIELVRGLHRRGRTMWCIHRPAPFAGALQEHDP